MKYKLISDNIKGLNPVQQILVNRGINLSDTDRYLHTSEKDLNDPFKLKFMEEAVLLLKNNIDDGIIFIQVDSDADGFTSASILYNYIRMINPNAKIHYRVHPGKEHGVNLDYLTELDVKPTLIIIPDAGSNQYEEHKEIYDMDISCLVLDHHDADEYSKYATIVNNQMCDYPNKSLSGAGIVYQFCRAYDIKYGYNFANEFIDLAATGMIADMMDVRDLETRYIINAGINSIKNPLLQGLIDKQSFALKDGLTPTGIGFYIAPSVNAVIRVGTLEEKTKLFEAMLDENKDKIVPSTKRGFNGMEEYLIEQIVRESGNIRNRQNRLRDSGIDEIECIIKENNLNEHQIIIIKTNGILDKTLSGLIANQLMFKYQKPVLLLRETDNGILEGSARGYDKSELNDLKSFIQNSSMFEYAEGHASAFGCGIQESKINEFINYANKELSHISFEAYYLVDFIFNANDITHSTIYDIASLNSFWGKGLEQSEILIKGIKATKDNVVLLEKGPTLKIESNGITYIKFKSSKEEYESILSDGYTLIDVVGKCSINTFNENMSPQILISSISVGQKVDYYF